MGFFVQVVKEECLRSPCFTIKFCRFQRYGRKAIIMRYLKTFYTLLLAGVFSVFFAACSSDEPEDSNLLSAKELVGTKWEADPQSPNKVQVVFTDEKNLQLTVVTSKGIPVMDKQAMEYVYDEKTGNLTVTFMGVEVKGAVTKSALKLSVPIPSVGDIELRRS